MKMLKTKHFRRIVVFLAMLAPVVYLFGSLFSALAGAHGTQVFADDSDNSLSYELDTVQGYIDDSTGALSPGNSSQFCVAEFFDVTSYQGCSLVVNTSGVSSITVLKYDSSQTYLNYSRAFAQQISLNIDFSYFRIYYYSPNTQFPLCNVTISGDFVPAVISAENYSDYVFNQFFAKDNFLVQIGKDVLSENPHGFVPFASFWKYLDNNMLHMGDMQLGLMGYGYVYYCCHVLLFDIAFILVTFFLDFIQKVNDKIVGGVD